MHTSSRRPMRGTYVHRPLSDGDTVDTFDARRPRGGSHAAHVKRRYRRAARHGANQAMRAGVYERI